jgi:iron complex transport system ATP-binding protein
MSAVQAPVQAQVQVRGLGVTLGRSRVLDGVDLVVPEGAWTAIVGPNGAGKSTLLRAVAGLIRHDGQVLLAGQDAAGLRPRQRAALVGYAPQVPTLPPAMTVVEYVGLGRTPYRSLLSGPQARDRDVVDRALRELDLTELAPRLLRTLSGGERQRAVLARALAQEPSVLLLDEPTAALDLGHAQQVLDLVDRLRLDQGLTVISTLHDLVLAGQYAQRLMLLAGGRVVAEGAPAQVLTDSALAEHYGARARVEAGPDGVRVHPLRRPA